MKKNRIPDYIVSYDKLVLVTYVALLLTGVVIMLDITSIQTSLTYFFRHTAYAASSFIIMIVALYFFNLEKLRSLNLLFILVVIALLLIVLALGPEVNGATRQLRLGPLSIQPSFLARLALVFFLAGFLARKQEQLRITEFQSLVKEFLPPILVTVVIFGIIILERHLSTLIIGGCTLVGMLFYAGMRKRYVFLILALGLILGSLVIMKGEGYRKERLKAFKTYSLFTKNRPAPSNDPGEYQVHESLTALTTGSWLGTGMGYGRAKHYFLPEANTDYVYTIIGEEFGFVGAIIILLLQALLFFRAFRIAEAQTNLYFKYLCAGLAFNIFLNTLVNTGVAISILPPTGNTLPFISYGGTALLTDSLSVGVILNISAKRRSL